jgi:hypothetical protein
MASPAKIAANRRNARRSTGPRSAAGKARARRNAFRHGLATPASLDHVAMDRIDDLVVALTRDFPSKLELELATLAAEAQSEIERVRQAKVSMVKRAYAHLRDEGGRLLSAGERAALAFAGKTEILMACERYERRAISRRNRALQALAKLQRELRKKEAIEFVGPPRPKLPRTRHIPFREEDVLRLEVEQVMRSSPPMGRVNFSCSYGWQRSKSMVGVYVTTEGDRGFLDLRFQVNGRPIAQTFELAGEGAGIFRPSERPRLFGVEPPRARIEAVSLRCAPSRSMARRCRALRGRKCPRERRPRRCLRRCRPASGHRRHRTRCG